MQILDLREKQNLLSHYWIEMAMKGSNSVGGARQTILRRIVKGIWLSAISSTKEDIGSECYTKKGSENQ